MPHLSGMIRKTANIDIRVEPQLVERIDAWRARQRAAPSRSAAIVYMLEHFLENDPAGLNAADWPRLLSRARESQLAVQALCRLCRLPIDPPDHPQHRSDFPIHAEQ